jgi:septum formation topological specificity factor MinE
VKHVSNAEIAKQRLRMILISDRCEISDVAKQKIVNNVVGALSSFVEIESEEKVQLNVSADPDLGTVYSVIVPVRRVKAEYQEYGENLRDFQYGDSFGTMRALNLRFERVDDGVE